MYFIDEYFLISTAEYFFYLYHQSDATTSKTHPSDIQTKMISL